MMKVVDKDSCYSEMTVSVSTDALFAPPAAWDHDSETCLKFSDKDRFFAQFLVVRTISTNSVTLLLGNFVKVAKKQRLCISMLYSTHTHTRARARTHTHIHTQHTCTHTHSRMHTHTTHAQKFHG